MVESLQKLLVPKGIRFSCSECGNCCLHWPVPATEGDFKKITDALPELQPVLEHSAEESLRAEKLFKVLQVEDKKLAVFTHSLEKREDGKCAFLSSENRCIVHEKLGCEMKPSMCRLFPYTFTGTPDGVYCSISFASTATLFNQGELLDSESEELNKKYELFRSLFPELNLDWSQIQVIDGVSLSWSDYRKHESTLLSELESTTNSSVRTEKILFDEAENFRRMVPAGGNLDNLAGFEARPKLIDQVLVKELLEFYLPDAVFQDTNFDMKARTILGEVLQGSGKVTLARKGVEYDFGKLFSTRLSGLSSEQLDMVRRFVYLRVFSKLFFGPGFNYLSVISGFHHLIMLVVLARISLKLDLLSGELSEVELASEKGLMRLAEYLRTMERKLTVAHFSEETIAMLEVLLASPQRMERLIGLSG